MTKILNTENVVKLCGGVIAVCGLYYALDKRVSLMEQKLDYYIAISEGKEHEAKLVVAELKAEDKEINNELQKLSLRLAAIMPKQIRLEDEQN